MGATAEPAAEQSMAGRLGFKPGQVVQEFGYDDDVDDDLRAAIEEVTGNELADEDAQDVVDVALLLVARRGRRPGRLADQRADEPGRRRRHLAAHPQVRP